MFDQIVVVDWSANSTPKRGTDSIWVAVAEGDRVRTENLPTRHLAEQALGEIVDSDPLARTLIGVDFSLGYPKGTAASLGLADPPWKSMWSMLADKISDNERNHNNRFAIAAALNDRISSSASPFWGCPPSAAAARLGPRRPTNEGVLPEWRLVEKTLSATGRRPFSIWQLLGAGCVGSQSLVGIPVLDRLGTRYRDRLAVWPFTTGLSRPDVARGRIVVAEVWPSLLTVPVGLGEVRDEAQVRVVAKWLMSLDACDRIGDLFAPSVPCNQVSTVVGEEGWVLGAGVDAELLQINPD